MNGEVARPEYFSGWRYQLTFSYDFYAGAVIAEFQNMHLIRSSFLCQWLDLQIWHLLWIGVFYLSRLFN